MNLKISNEDNMNLMTGYPDNFFDLAIIDLEYCIGASKPSIKPNFTVQKNGNKLNVRQPNYTQKDWDFKSSCQEYFNELINHTMLKRRIHSIKSKRGNRKHKPRRK